MAKSAKRSAPTDHQRGDIRDNAYAALVTSVIFRSRVVKAKKGKGSYSRKGQRFGNDSALAVFKALKQLCVPSPL